MWKCTLSVFLSHIHHRRNNKLFSSFIDSSSLFHDAKIMCFFSRRENPYETFLQILIIKALWSSKLTWHLNFSQQFMDLICRFLTDFGVFPETTCGFWHIKKEQHCCFYCCWTTRGRTSFKNLGLQGLQNTPKIKDFHVLLHFYVTIFEI